MCPVVIGAELIVDSRAFSFRSMPNCRVQGPHVRMCYIKRMRPAKTGQVHS
jgi:hypothetical protein